MAIEGPLRELGVHDVFQLLDLSRKTGVLTIVGELRRDEGKVYFERGRVVAAALRSHPHTLGAALLRGGRVSETQLADAREAIAGGRARTLGEALVQLGAVNAREVERQARQLVEAIVFEVMSWREGNFSFEEGEEGSAPAEAPLRLPIDSLLMEGARRVDEWSRIADAVPHLGVVPSLAPIRDESPTMLDLRPAEWEVLGAVDGERDLRAIAAALGVSEFDVARTAYGLVVTGVLIVHEPQSPAARARGAASAVPHVERARAALAARRFEEALDAARQGIAVDPGSAEARLSAARALAALGRAADAADELRRAAQADPLHPEVQRELGFAAARRGDFAGALASWEHYLRIAPSSTDASRVRAARDAAARLHTALEAHALV
jgi:tetratricopeptide (TPR) repeat protein